MNMIDSHCHLDLKKGNCRQAMEYLFGEARAAGVQGIILLNLLSLGTSNDELLQSAQSYGAFFKVFPSFHPQDKAAVGELSRLKRLGVKGLKLHPLRDNYSVLMPQSVDLIKAAGDLGLPVLIDCFPWGKNMVLGNMPDAFARLAEAAPQTRIAIAHSGGHLILDALMVAKNYKNIYLDLALTLLYYRGSTVTQDLAYAVNCMRGERIFWGSDYPDREYQETVSLTKEEIGKWHLNEEYQNKIWHGNVLKFLGESK
jgi:predicted TIM-barrel fold metal-dependent hydrolase